MKLGYAGALCCAVVALLGAGLVYWDLQDDTFMPQLLVIPIMPAMLGLALLLFPGGPTTLQQGLEHNPNFIAQWRQQVPRLHARMWVLSLALSLYLSMYASFYLQGKDFFEWGNQLIALGMMGLLYHWLRRQRAKDKARTQGGQKP